MMNNNFQPCILEPTRITANNKPSLIDNIFLNTVEKDVHAGNFTTKLSDHLPQFMFIDDVMPIPTKKNREIRNLSKFNPGDYKDDIKSINLVDINAKDASALYSDFPKTVSRL